MADFILMPQMGVSEESALLSEAIKALGVAKTEEHCDDCIFCRAKSYLYENREPIILGVRIALVGCAVLFIILGVTNGGMSDVLNKAIKICTECIGLG